MRHTLAHVTPRAGLEGQIYGGLEQLTQELLDRSWIRGDGAKMRIPRCLIDANWGQSTDVVYQVCRQSGHGSIVTASHGRFAGAASQPFAEYRRKPGDHVALNWRMPAVSKQRQVRHVAYDTNWWKSFVHARLRVAMGTVDPSIGPAQWHPARDRWGRARG